MLTVSLPAKSLQEFATVLRNLEDERMRMVRPQLCWEQGWWHLGQRGGSDCPPQCSFPHLGWSCRGGQRKARVAWWGNAWKPSGMESCCGRAAGAGAGGSQVCRDGGVKPGGVCWGLWEGSMEQAEEQHS